MKTRMYSPRRLAPRTHEQINQKSTADILSILEKVDDRLSSLEQNMGPIRRVREGRVGGWGEGRHASPPVHLLVPPR